MKILVSVGTRPEFIKMAPVILEMKKRLIATVFLYTGQHRDLCRPLFDFFGIHPDIDLEIMKENQSLAHITSSILQKMDKVLDDEKPAIVLVHGDTSTTLASSLAAFYKQIPVGHVEAGLRSGFKYSPFPEEMNRTLTSRIAAYNFAPTNYNEKNLLNEGVDPKSIIITGNTVIDAVKIVASKISVQRKKQILITAHRRENFGEPMLNITGALKDIAAEFQAYELIYPVHPNPNVRKIVNSELGGIANIRLIEPLDYIDFIREMASSELCVTDSGGIQEEAPFFHIPVVVMRRETERTEGVEAGTLLLAGTERADIYNAIRNLLINKDYYNSFAKALNPYGDGTASAKIVDFISAV